MKNIILQHWTGPINELGKLSSLNISNYAKNLNADYKLLRGDVFRPNLKNPWPPIQKIHMLDKEFDDYDIVVMLDMDIFIRKNMNQNIFTDINGVGRHTYLQKKIVKNFQKKQPEIANAKYSYWGGSVYRLNQKMRQTLRSNLREEEIPLFCSRRMHGDEGLMHRLAVLSKIGNHYLPGDHWGRSSFERNVNRAALIHVRTKISPKGPKGTKIENYRGLVRRGLIDE